MSAKKPLIVLGVWVFFFNERMMF